MVDVQSYEGLLAGEVVLVDDSKPLVDIATAMLTKLGCSVTGFTDGYAAIDYVTSKSNNVRLVISDQSMPIITGIELLQTVAKASSDQYLVLATSVPDPSRVDDYLALGIDAVLSKPFSLMDLCSMLDRMLATSQRC